MFRSFVVGRESSYRPGFLTECFTETFISVAVSLSDYANLGVREISFYSSRALCSQHTHFTSCCCFITFVSLPISVRKLLPRSTETADRRSVFGVIVGIISYSVYINALIPRFYFRLCSDDVANFSGILHRCSSIPTF